MHRLLQQIATSLLLVACAGCVVAGDGLLTVRGNLIALDASSECSLRLFSAGEKQARSYNTRTIKREFFEDFTVAPSARDYRIAVTCPGYQPVERTIRSAGSSTKVDLGTVALTR